MHNDKESVHQEKKTNTKCESTKQQHFKIRKAKMGIAEKEVDRSMIIAGDFKNSLLVSGRTTRKKSIRV